MAPLTLLQASLPVFVATDAAPCVGSPTRDLSFRSGRFRQRPTVLHIDGTVHQRGTTAAESSNPHGQVADGRKEYGTPKGVR